VTAPAHSDWISSNPSCDKLRIWMIWSNLLKLWTQL